MSIQNGSYFPQTEEQILDAMVADAKEYFGSDLKDDQLATIRLFYRPVASLLAEIQQDIGLVLDSSQIDNAQGTALDLLTSLIGVVRNPATKATGTATFSRDTSAGQDYTIPSGTEVQTESNSPTKYLTTETVTLVSGTTSVDASIESVSKGVDQNVGPNTLTVMPDPPAGVESVTNSTETTGGSDEEVDDELRLRAKNELAQGSRASAPALINSARRLQGVNSVSIFINDTNNDNTGTGGLPDHAFELVVAGGNDQDIGQAILDTKAAGDTSYAGANGTATSVTSDLPNGQTHGIDFSRPTEISIYVDMSLEVTDKFGGKPDVRDEIVTYIGGLLSSGNDAVGDLGVGDDVIYGEIEFAIRSIEGVYDVTSLSIGTTASPTGTTNIAIADSEDATGDSTDGSITIGTTTVNP